MRKKHDSGTGLRDLQQLEYFVRVAELGSFTKAAAVLGVGQPSLSRQVRALEVGLKATLFRRNGRGASLTEVGQRFLDHSRGILKSVDAAVKSAHGVDANHGRVVIGLPPSVGKVFTPLFVGRFIAKYPHASLGVIEGLSGSLQEQLIAGRLDVAVLHNPLPSPHLAIEPVTTEALYLIGPRPVGRRGRTLKLAELAHLPLIFPTAPHTLRSLVEVEAGRLGVQLSISVEVDSVSTIVDLVSKGYGYSVVPKNMMRGIIDPRRSVWHRIDSPALKSTLCVVTSARQLATPLKEEATALVRTILAEVLNAPRAGRAAAKKNKAFGAC